MQCACLPHAADHPRPGEGLKGKSRVRGGAKLAAKKSKNRFAEGQLFLMERVVGLAEKALDKI